MNPRIVLALIAKFASALTFTADDTLESVRTDLDDLREKIEST